MTAIMMHFWTDETTIYLFISNMKKCDTLLYEWKAIVIEKQKRMNKSEDR